MATKLNTSQQWALKGQQPSGLHYRVLPAKGSDHLPQLSSGEAHLECWIQFCASQFKRHGHNETSLVKDHGDNLKPEASKTQKAKRAGAIQPGKEDAQGESSEIQWKDKGQWAQNEIQNIPLKY